MASSTPTSTPTTLPDFDALPMGRGTRFLHVMSGPVGRAIRVAAGLGMIGGGLASDHPALALAGVLPLATGALDLCPIALARRLPVGGRAFREATCRR